MSAIDEVESQPQLTDEEFEALKERVKEQGAVVKASKEVRPNSCLVSTAMSPAALVMVLGYSAHCLLLYGPLPISRYSAAYVDRRRADTITE